MSGGTAGMIRNAATSSGPTRSGSDRQCRPRRMLTIAQPAPTTVTAMAIASRLTSNDQAKLAVISTVTAR